MKKSLPAVLLTAALAIGIGGQTVFARGFDLGFGLKGDTSADVEQGDSLRVQSDSNVDVQHEDGFWGSLKSNFFLGARREDDNSMKLGDRHEDEDNDQDATSSDKDVNENKQSDEQHNPALHTIAGVARVTAISGATITAEQSWRDSDKSGKSPKVVSIVTDADTQFMTRMNATTSLDAVTVGDLISFKGAITAKDDASYTVDASRVRVWGDVDLSAKAHATGTVQSVNETDSQLVIKTDDGTTITVNASDNTVVKDENGDRGVFADIVVGATVRVKGFWNSLKDTITAVKIRIL